LAAEVAGGLLMVAVLAVLFKYTLRARLVDEARRQAEKGIAGRMEGHAAMQHAMRDRVTAVSHFFYMDVASVAQDLVLGFLIAGALAAWVPNDFWRSLFVAGNPSVAQVWGPLIGPVIAMLSFVCSVGNIPLAAVLWNGGISFGGVISFIFADLLILPILDIYRRYYGGRMSLYLLGTSYVAMVLAGLVIGGLFQLLGLVPSHPAVEALQAPPSWNYTTFLDLAALALCAVLGWRFFSTGGMAMHRAMEGRPPADRVRRHLQYESYLLNEILPRLPGTAIACGTSFGALHAVLLAARHPSRVGGFIALSGAYDTAKWLNGYHDDNTYFTNLMAFLPGLTDEAYLGPLRAQHPKVIATGEQDPNVEDSLKLARLFAERGVPVGLEIWPGWAHDWPYWKDMMRRY